MGDKSLVTSAGLQVPNPAGLPPHLARSVVEHLLPGWVQPVFVGHDPLLSHENHLPGRVVHADGSLVPQGSLLGLLLCL